MSCRLGEASPELVRIFAIRTLLPKRMKQAILAIVDAVKQMHRMRSSVQHMPTGKSEFLAL